jgi:hypothetical protein
VKARGFRISVHADLYTRFDVTDMPEAAHVQ